MRTSADATALSLEQRASAMTWLTIDQAAAHAQLSKKTLYGAVRAGKLRAARVGGRRQLRFRAEWIDQWLEASAPQELNVRPAPALFPKTVA